MGPICSNSRLPAHYSLGVQPQVKDEATWSLLGHLLKRGSRSAAGGLFAQATVLSAPSWFLSVLCTQLQLMGHLRRPDFFFFFFASFWGLICKSTTERLYIFMICISQPLYWSNQWRANLSILFWLISFLCLGKWLVISSSYVPISLMGDAPSNDGLRGCYPTLFFPPIKVTASLISHPSEPYAEGREDRPWIYLRENQNNREVSGNLSPITFDCGNVRK